MPMQSSVYGRRARGAVSAGLGSFSLFRSVNQAAPAYEISFSAGVDQKRVDQLEKRVRMLEEQLASLHAGRQIVVVLDTLSPEPLTLIRPFGVNVDPHDSGFRAWFVDANLMAFGETVPEAIWNLKDIIAATFELLTAAEAGELGPGPMRQLAVLSQFVRR